MKHSFASYIIRIDDVCPTMNWELFSMIADICDECNIHPILGIIPDNQDQKLVVSHPKEIFWEYMKERAEKGWIIAQHGYQHMYEPDRKTEFAGLPYDEQYRKIKRGQEILEEKLGFKPTWWMAPAHSFDTTTCHALKKLGFMYITDGVALYPYILHGLTWIPQQLWRPRMMLFGTWTICLHPNTMTINDIHELANFIKKYSDQFQTVSINPKKSVFNLLFKMIWHTTKYVR